MAHPVQDDTHGRILDAAVSLFAERGYGATSVREVCEAAGVTKPTLYYHFGSKEGLFRAIVDLHLGQLTRIIEEAVSTPGSLATRLRAYVAALTSHTQRHPEGMKVLESAHHGPDAAKAGVNRDELLAVHQRNAEHLSALLQEGVVSGELRADLDCFHTVLSLIGMTSFHCKAASLGFPLPDDHADRLVSHFLNGVAA